MSRWTLCGGASVVGASPTLPTTAVEEAWQRHYPDETQVCKSSKALGDGALSQRKKPAFPGWAHRGWRQLDTRERISKSSQQLAPQHVGSLVCRDCVESSSRSWSALPSFNAMETGTPGLDSRLSKHLDSLPGIPISRKRQANQWPSEGLKKSRVPMGAPCLPRGTPTGSPRKVPQGGHSSKVIDIIAEQRGLDEGPSKVTSTDGAETLSDTRGDCANGFEDGVDAAGDDILKDLRPSANDGISVPEGREETGARKGKTVRIMQQDVTAFPAWKTNGASQDAFCPVKNQEASTTVHEEQHEGVRMILKERINHAMIEGEETLQEAGNTVLENDGALPSSGDENASGGVTGFIEDKQTSVANAIKTAPTGSTKTAFASSQQDAHSLKEGSSASGTASFTLQTSVQRIGAAAGFSGPAEERGTEVCGGEGEQESSKPPVETIQEVAVCRSIHLATPHSAGSDKGDKSSDFRFVTSSVPVFNQGTELKPGGIFPMASAATGDKEHSQVLEAATDPGKAVDTNSNDALGSMGNTASVEAARHEDSVAEHDKRQQPIIFQMKSSAGSDTAAMVSVGTLVDPSAGKGSSSDELPPSQCGLSPLCPEAAPSIFKLGCDSVPEDTEAPGVGPKCSQESSSSFSFSLLPRAPAFTPLPFSFPICAVPQSLDVGGEEPFPKLAVDSAPAPALLPPTQVIEAPLGEQNTVQTSGGTSSPLNYVTSSGAALQSVPNQDTSGSYSRCLPDACGSKALSFGPFSSSGGATQQTRAPNMGTGLGFPSATTGTSTIAGVSGPDGACCQVSSSLPSTLNLFNSSPPEEPAPKLAAVHSPATTPSSGFHTAVPCAFGSLSSSAGQEIKTLGVFGNASTSAPFCFNTPPPAMEMPAVFGSAGLNAISGETCSQMNFSGVQNFGASSGADLPFGGVQPTTVGHTPFGAPFGGPMLVSGAQGLGSPLNFSFGASSPEKGFVFGASQSINLQGGSDSACVNLGGAQGMPVFGSFCEPSEPGSEAGGALFSMGQSPMGSSRPTRRLRIKRNRRQA